MSALLQLFQLLHLLFPDRHFLVGQMSLGVFRQVIAPDELLGTHRTLVLFLARVRTSVASKFVRTCKRPSAVCPVAQVRFLARVRSHVGLEVRALVVHLAAAQVPAHEGFGSVLLLSLARESTGVGLSQHWDDGYEVLLN